MGLILKFQMDGLGNYAEATVGAMSVSSAFSTGGSLSESGHVTPSDPTTTSTLTDPLEKPTQKP